MALQGFTVLSYTFPFPPKPKDREGSSWPEVEGGVQVEHLDLRVGGVVVNSKPDLLVCILAPYCAVSKFGKQHAGAC